MTFKMRRLFLAGVGAICGLSASESFAAPSRWETLEAIHMVENPRNSRKPGPRGELGAYQFRAEVWRNYSRLPFSSALERARSDEVAVKHYEWLKATLVSSGFEASVYNIALAWNAGIGSVVRGTIPARSRDYAARVNNLAAELHARLAPKPTGTLVADIR